MEVKDVRYLFGYTEWANHLLLDAVAQLNEEQLHRDVQISHRSAFSTLVHMMAAEWIWLERWLGTSPRTMLSADSFANLDDIRVRWSEIEGTRRVFLEGLSDAVLNGDLNYTNTKDQAFSYPLVRVMQHVINHATLHRGQVVSIVRQMGGVPPATDLLFYFPHAS